jgi:hypothetical protein
MHPAPEFERFTGQARRAIWLAYQEAQRFEHDFLASDHLLAGLLREGSREISHVFREQHVESDDILAKLEMALAQSQPAPSAGSVFLTPRANRELFEAVQLARQGHATQANATHILLAMLADPDGSTREFLEQLGLDVERAGASLRRAALAPNRDLLVQAASLGADAGRADPTPAQLAQLLARQPPYVELTADAYRAAIDPSLAATDYQLFLTQLILAVTMGLAGGYVLYEGIDGMAAAAVIFGLIACFRNSLLGLCAGATLGGMIAQRFQFGLPFFDPALEIFIPLVIIGAFIGSFLGNFWRRVCPKYLQPSLKHQKPPGVV